MTDTTAPTSPDTAGDNNTVQLHASHDLDGVPYAHAVLTPESDTSRKEILLDPRPAIPVIFLPGVMGSLLVHKKTGATIWYPPNMDSVWSMLPGGLSVLGGYTETAVERQIRFDPTVAVVDPTGPVISFDKERLGLNKDEARRRGWSTVHRWSYQPTLVWLQDMLNHPMIDGELNGIWGKGDPEGKKDPMDPILGTSPSAYGGYGEGKAITKDSEEFKSFIKYRYPVYAIGYNFLQSNEASGQQVLDGVDFVDPDSQKATRIMGIREICRENKTDKAIVITHSMGGLVARMASQFCNGEQDILGVIHGAQPATGAPLFAKRFRTGGEDFINKSLMGRNDAEFIAIAANAEGPMELSPMPDYNDGKPWWIFADKDGNEIMSLPEVDPISELYANEAWYGMLPYREMLDPAGIVKKRLDEKGSSLSVYENYLMTIGDVVKRQYRLINKYHPNTYASYGDGALQNKTPSDKDPSDLLAWGAVVWQGNFPKGVTKEDLKKGKILHDSHKGEISIETNKGIIEMAVQKREMRRDTNQPVIAIVPGDGTVPGTSAKAQGRGLLPNESDKVEGMKMVFRQGGFEHQFSFKHPWTRWSVLYSMVHMVHNCRGNAL